MRRLGTRMMDKPTCAFFSRSFWRRRICRLCLMDELMVEGTLATNPNGELSYEPVSDESALLCPARTKGWSGRQEWINWERT